MRTFITQNTDIRRLFIIQILLEVRKTFRLAIKMSISFAIQVSVDAINNNVEYLRISLSIHARSKSFEYSFNFWILWIAQNYTPVVYISERSTEF